jgi:hypothetical protein
MVDSEEVLSPPADTMRERVGDSRPKVWFLIDGNRWAIAGILLGISFLVITLVGLAFPRSFETALTTSSIRSLFQSIFLATVTSIALTLTIGQLILSEEMGDLGEQRSRMQDEIQFRKDVQTSMDVGVPPATPTGFLRTLLLGARQDATALREQVAGEPDSEAAAEIKRLATLVDEHGKQVMGTSTTRSLGRSKRCRRYSTSTTPGRPEPPAGSEDATRRNSRPRPTACSTSWSRTSVSSGPPASTSNYCTTNTN